MASGALPPAFPARAHRRRAVLGRRHLLEHADRGRARRQAAPRLADLRRATCGTRRRPSPTSIWAGDGAAARTSSSRAAPTATSRGRSRSTGCATSSASCASRSRPSAQRRSRGQGARVVGLRHDDARRAPARAAPRRRGPHQGHRLHDRAASARAGGRLRRHDAHDREARRGSAPADPIEGVVIHDLPSVLAQASV